MRKIIMKSVFICVFLISSVSATAVDEFIVTNKILLENPPKFGMNLSFFGGVSPWTSMSTTNVWNQGVAFEQIQFTYPGICDGGGADYLENKYGNKLSYWTVMNDGFWQPGSKVDIYRIENGKMKLMRTATVKKSFASDKNGYRVYFNESGKPVRSGDFYCLRMKANESRSQFRYPRMQERGNWFGIFMPTGKNVNWVIDPTTYCKEAGSKASMKISLKKEKDGSIKKGGMFQWFLADDISGNWVAFNDDKPYKFQVWMKQKGIPDGTVDLEIGPYLKTKLKVGEKWEKYTFEIPNESYYQLSSLLISELKRSKGDKKIIAKLTKTAQNLKKISRAKPQIEQALYKKMDMQKNKPEYWEALVENIKERAKNVPAPPRMQTEIDAFIKRFSACPSNKYINLEKEARKIHKNLYKFQRNTAMDNWYKLCKTEAETLIKLLANNNFGKTNNLIDRIQKVVLLPYVVTKLQLTFKGETLWLDNMLLWQNDLEPFETMPWVVKELKDFQPGTIRLWQGLLRPTFDAWVKDGFATPTVGKVKTVEGFNGFSLYRGLKLCQDTGADPWLIFYPFYSKEDVKHLMEYLYAPPDVGFGIVRAQQGQKEPWSKVFKKIYLECSNEAWNSMFNPRAWPARPDIYTRIADMQFKEIKKSPYYSQFKPKLVYNGWSQGTKRGYWSNRVSEFGQEGDMLDYGHYFGGWDGLTVLGKNDEELFSRLLLYGPHVMDRQMIRGLNMDPDFSQKVAKIMVSDSSLREQISKDIKLTDKEKKEYSPAKDNNGNASIQEQISDIFKNEKENTEVVKSLSRLRPSIQTPAGEFLAKASERKAFLPTSSKILKTTPERVKTIIRTWKNPRGIYGAVKKDPGLIDDFEAYAGHDKWAQKDIADYRAGKRAHAWGLINVIANSLPKQLIKELKNNPQMEESLIETFNGYTIAEAVKKVHYGIDSVLKGMVNRQMVILKMKFKENPVFAKEFCQAMQSNDDCLDEASKILAHEIVNNTLKGLKVPKSRYQHYIEFKDLPVKARKELIKNIKMGIDYDYTQPDPAIAKFARALLDAISGDNVALNKLKTDPVFIKSLKKRINDGIADIFLQAMIQNGDIAEKMNIALNRLPQGNKKVLQRSVYESGSGYSLPAPGKEVEEESERVGKSLTLGIVTLDSFMSNLAQGFGPQCYYQLKMGSYWSSHNNYRDLFPHPSWLALRMRNVHCKGDLMEVNTAKVAKIDIPTQNVYSISNNGSKKAHLIEGRKKIPMTVCYAFKDKKKHSFMVLNRSFTKAHEIKLRLPFTPSPNATMFLLAHKDPRTTNRKQYLVKEKKIKIKDFNKKYTFSIAPSSACVIVCHEK